MPTSTCSLNGGKPIEIPILKNVPRKTPTIHGLPNRRATYEAVKALC
jgi:hypothetical protein